MSSSTPSRARRAKACSTTGSIISSRRSIPSWRVQVAVTLDPTDICYGFYSYQEPDIVFTDLDVNPFTNQNVRNRIVQFFYKPHSSDPFRTIFYQVLNNDGSVFLTNDPNPGYPTGDSGVIFGSMVVGTSRGVQSFETTDIRNRGGGLAPQWQSIPRPSTSGISGRSTASLIPWPILYA
jgi:hypothetical protein